MRVGQGGLSFIELLVSLVILTLLASLALPNFQRLAQQYRIRSAASMLYHHLQLARSEAIKRNSAITVCFSGSGAPNWRYQIAQLTQASDCEGQVVQLIEQGSAKQFPALMLSAHYPNPYLIFKPRRTSLAAGNITLTQGPYHLKVRTWNNGIIRTCSESRLSGVALC